MPCYQPVNLPVKCKSLKAGARSIWSERTLPCGKCLGCRGKQARDWSIRLMNETQMHEHAWFMTLTYSNERLPENGSLNPPHLQGFFKALRRERPGKKISYYACGEYGDQTERPHYHAVLYGPDLLDRVPLRSPAGFHVWRASTLEKYWPYGHSEFSTVTPASASYVAGYVRKKLSKKTHPNAYTRVDEDTGELIELEQEFSRMSLKPAIGRRWIEKYWRDVYPRDYVLLGGKEFKPPRYYDKWMEENHPKVMFGVRCKREDEAMHIPEEKLKSKEKIHQARNNLFQKRKTL